MIDFNGRDLLREFRGWLEPLGIRLSYQRLEKELTDALIDVYSENRSIHGKDDFLELANGVRELAQLPPLA